MLLVDDDQPDAPHRREHGRAGADDDARLAARDPVALVAPLRVAERGVQDRDPVAEPLAEAPDGLRGERDLRHEHDRPESPLQRGAAGLEVHLGLAAPGRPLEQDVLADPLVERRHDELDGRALIGRERLRLGLAGEGLPLGGRGPLAARGASHRGDELQRARRGGPVVVRHPEREVDERGRDLVEQAPDRGRLDARAARRPRRRRPPRASSSARAGRRRPRPSRPRRAPRT